jgi:flagellar motor switch protein FliG
MAEIDYPSLSRQQKLALFLIVIGPDAAADVLRQFGDPEAEQICREMSQYPMIPEAIQRSVLDEFTGLVAQSATSTMGGLPFAEHALGLAKGDSKASSIMGRLSPVGRPVKVIEYLGEMEGGQIFNMLKQEHPQTVAFVLSHLDGGKAAEVFSFFSPDMRDELIERIGTIESTPVALVDKISRSLGRHFDPRTRPAFHHSGGVRSVAGLLNQMEKNVTKTLLAHLDERNNALSAAVRKQMFGFEEIGKLQPADMQRLLREVDSVQLATALKGATEPLRAKVCASLTKRAAEGLREELEMLGSVKHKEIEAAQLAIIQIVRRLEDEGQISLDNDGPESAVA